MQKMSFNKNWNFHEGGGSSLEGMMGNQEDVKNVTIPHDASIGKLRNPNDARGSGNGFFQEENYHYTKAFSLDESNRDKNIWLEFEGVYQNAFVYINNAYVGKCPYGYSNFYLDITKYVSFSTINNVKVIVKNGVSSGRWYTGGGIYRDVNLMIADRLHIMPDGVQLSTQELEKDLAVIRVETELEYTGTGIRDVVIVSQLRNGDKIVAETKMPVTIEEHSRQKYRQTLYVSDPILWDAESPNLYHYQVKIEEQGNQFDIENGTFGIRKLQLDKYHGLRVNGKVVNLRGGCIHHDNGIIGSAEFSHSAETRIKKLKEVGYNAIRSSHYPLSRKLLEACDQLGMYVMDEFSDVWTATKVDFDYGIHMSEWWEHDITNMVKKDYNHPSVIMYSIGNEIPETGNKYDVQWGKKLSDKIRELDDSRYVTNSLNLMLSVMDKVGEIMGDFTDLEHTADGNQEINSMMSDLGQLMDIIVTNKIAGDMTEEAASQVDIVGYNYAAARYEKDGSIFSNRILVGSETYPQDLDVNWELVERLPYLIGDFSWTAWDYLGEAGIGKVNYGDQTGGMMFYAPYPCKAAYCGDMNLIGDRRPISYWREIIWGFRNAPYIAVQPPMHYDEPRKMTRWSMTDAVRSWNWEGWEGKPVRVEVYTADQEAALYVNGKLTEKRRVGEEKKDRVIFETVYTPGIVEVITYINGEENGRDSVATADSSTVLTAVTDCDEIPADESDICFVDVSLHDENGILHPGAMRKIAVEVDGPGVIIGFGSADPESVENYFDSKVMAYEGRLRAAVRGTGEKGIIKVTFSAKDMKSVSVMIKAV